MRKMGVVFKFMVLSLCFLLVSCDFISLMNAGTHGSLGGYGFNVSKDSLETAIKSVIEIEEKITKLDGDGVDWVYVKILIQTEDTPYYFVFRFYGDEDDWKASPDKSEIFITSFRVGENGYENGKEISRKRKKLANKIFKGYFIDSIEKRTGLVTSPVSFP